MIPSWSVTESQFQSELRVLTETQYIGRFETHDLDRSRVPVCGGQERYCTLESHVHGKGAQGHSKTARKGQKN